MGSMCLGKVNTWEEVSKDHWLSEDRISKEEAEKQFSEMEKKAT